MDKRMTVMSWIVVALLWLVACAPSGAEPTAKTGESADLPNPASVYCEEQGGRVDMRADASGIYGVCIFGNGSECEEWAYYRGECSPGQSTEGSEPGFGLANPASVYCEEQGGRLEMRTDRNGTQGLCLFDDGRECEEWAYWRGECGPPSSDTRVNVALDAGLVGTVKVELLELDPDGAPDPYRLRLTLDDGPQLGEMLRTLNTAAPRMPKTFCLPPFLFRFHQPDGSVVEFGYLCDPANPTLSGEQGFWRNQEAAAPASLVALVDRLLGSEQMPPAAKGLNLVTEAGLHDTVAIEVWVQHERQENGMTTATVALLREIDEVETVAELVALLDQEFPLAPRARCLANTTLIFRQADGSSYETGYGCQLENADFLRGEEGYWQGQDLVAPPAFQELIQAAVGLTPLAPDQGETGGQAVAWYGYVVSGDWPVHYGVWSADPVLAEELASLRDTGRSFQIWGELTAGVPDANATQIVVTRIEPID
jgi:putative hemolysin